MKADDLTPAAPGRMSNTDNRATLRLLFQMQDQILALKTADTRQHTLVDQANKLVNDLVEARWLLVQQNDTKFPLPILVFIVLLLIILFVIAGKLCGHCRACLATRKSACREKVFHLWLRSPGPETMA